MDRNPFDIDDDTDRALVTADALITSLTSDA